MPGRNGLVQNGPSQNWDFGAACAGLLDPANRSSTKIIRPKRTYRPAMLNLSLICDVLGQVMNI